MNPPTARRLEVLRLIASGVTTYRALADALGARSSSAATDHIAWLEGRGLIVTERFRAGAIRVTDAGYAALGPCVCMTQMLDLIEARQGASSPMLIWALGFRHCPECGRRQPGS